MMSQDKVTAHFKKRKSAQAPAPVGKTRSAAHKETQAQAQQQQQQQQANVGPHTDADLSADERVLRSFDLTSKFGPCAGMTRLERWQRALKLGLDPPAQVLDILNRHGPNSPADHNLWHNRI